MSATGQSTELWTSGIFAGLPADFLEQLQSVGEIVELGPRETLFSEHDPATKVYVIASGEVQLAVCVPNNRTCRQIAVVGPGELLGWSAVTDRSRLFDTARTLSPVSAWVIEGEKLLEVCRKIPGGGFELMHRIVSVLGERLTSTRMQLVELSGAHLPSVALESD
ncbi:MAG: Crp/Fnr family transcriptional regulator [Planctomycetales bacterium]|nr:Crp/Fnr family transcriptional regulator [Planctomycetales bacterium]